MPKRLRAGLSATSHEPTKVKNGASEPAEHSCWPGWVPASREELQQAGGALPWAQLQKALVKRYCAAHRTAPSSSSRALPSSLPLLRLSALASLPQEYLSRTDHFVRLPQAEAGCVSRGLGEELAAKSGGGGGSCEKREDSSSSGEEPPTELPSEPFQICKGEASFAAALQDASGKLVVVEFTASWCRVCQKIQSDLNDLAAEMPEVVFLEVDVDANVALANRYNVKSMPTFLFFRKSECVGTFADSDVDALTLNIIDHK